MTMMPCQNCSGGRVVETHLIGDGQPGVTTKIEKEEYECPMCNGTGEIEDPHADMEET